MTKSLKEQIADALAGPSDGAFVAWVVGEAAALNPAIEHVLLGKFDEAAEAPKPGLPTQEMVLQMYEKLGKCLGDGDTHEQARGLQTEYVLVGATLFDLAGAFCKDTPDRLEAVLADLCENAPWLPTEIEASADLLAEQLEQFQEKYAKHTETEEGCFDQAFVAKLRDDIEWYQSVAWSWLCLIEFCPYAVAALLHDSQFVLELAKTSDVATKLLLKLGSGEHSADDETVDGCRALIKKLKWEWIALAYDVLKSLFDAAAHAHTTAADGTSQDSANFSVMLDIIEAIETADTELTPFENAPFLLDLENRFGLKQMFTIAAAMTGHLDSAHLDYVTMTIDQLLAMTKPLYRDGFDSLVERMEGAELSDKPGLDVDGIAEQLAAVSIVDADIPAAVAQVQEMIPDLGPGFVRACLAHYGGSAEAVVNALLEGSLPPELADMDRKAESWTPPATGRASSDVLDSRKNVFDGDEFDILRHNTLDWSRVSMGKSQKGGAAGQPTDDMKDRIVDMARRIAEEDEYDDTYDDTAQDGVVDAPDAPEDTAADPISKWEGDLVAQYQSDPAVLGRGKGTRKSAGRQALREKTGLSDEQIEGWYIMFQKNPNRERVLDKYGEQSTLEPESKAAGNGSSGKPNYGSKEKNKAKIGNHDRKKQHARKTQSNS
ncbi:hypothetical protein GGF46_001911 [Coemansia sp. RSA 552]|nr:hypothetical protein GGF46_001911 [Coemansia sp. RSA 552]